MDFTTKTISKSILRFLVISLSMLTIASCSKENDEVAPEEPVSTIEITNLEDGQEINESSIVIETLMTTVTGNVAEPSVTLTNTETNESVSFDLIGKIPKINGGYTTTMQAEVTIEEEGEYEVVASYGENGEGNNVIVISEKINITFDLGIEE